MLKIYDTLKKDFRNISEEFRAKTIRLYTCGPTVYDEAHIGNLRSYIAADVLRRVLAYNGYNVRWVMNITDVDDKTIKRTVDEFGPQATPADLRTYTDRYIAQFKKDLEAVNIPIDEQHVTFIRVSDVIEEIKAFIKKLIQLGYGYTTDDGAYFSIKKYQDEFGDYGDLVGKDFLKGKKVGARVKVDDYTKDDLSDFALWKARDTSDGNIFWPDTELGDGRPGWHIECSVINHIAFGGSPTDIHTGGVDLIFPHHTNEIAQSQPFYHPFARHWFHSEHLLVDGHKMAKRENNFYTLRDLQKEMPDAGMAFRYLTLMISYRKQMNFTKTALLAAKSGLQAFSKYRFQEPFPLVSKTNYEDAFREDLDDDLNTAGAIGTLYMLLGYKGEVVANLVDKMANVLGINFIKPEVPQNIQKLADEREKFRANQQFMQADDLRKQIDALGYEMDDTPHGPILWPKNPN